MNRDKTRVDTSKLYSKSNELFIIYFILLKDEEEYGNEVETYSSVKRLKGKLKKIPVRLQTSSINKDNTIQKGIRKIIKRNINVTNFDQVFYVLITCIFSWLFYLLYASHFIYLNNPCLQKFEFIRV